MAETYISGGGNGLYDNASFSSVVGGVGNVVYGSAVSSTIIGGTGNSMSGVNSVMSGGTNSTISLATNSVMGAGINNFITSGSNNVIGAGTNVGILTFPVGISNSANSSLFGGQNNRNYGGAQTTMLAGTNNIVASINSTTTTSNNSFVAGGSGNVVLATNSFGGGVNSSVQLGHDNSFVWNGSSSPVSTTASGQFILKSAGLVTLQTPTTKVSFPLTSGLTGQYLITDGSGNLVWSTSGTSNFVAATSGTIDTIVPTTFLQGGAPLEDTLLWTNQPRIENANLVSITNKFNNNIIVTGTVAGNATIYDSANTQTSVSLGAVGQNGSTIIQFNPTGTVGWGVGISSATAQIVTSNPTSGDVIVAASTTHSTIGFSGAPISFSGATNNLPLIGLTSAGSLKWFGYFSGGPPVTSTDVKNNGTDGGAVFSGQYAVPTATNNAFFSDNANNLSLFTNSGNAKNNGFLVKINSNGTTSWTSRVNGTANSNFSSVSLDSNNNVAATGVYNSTATIFNTSTSTGITLSTSSALFLAKFNSVGATQWATKIENAQNGYVTCDSSGNIYTAYTSIPSSSTINIYDTTGLRSNVTIDQTVTRNNAFITKYNTNGVYQWNDVIYTYTTTANTTATVNYIDCSNNRVVVGMQVPGHNNNASTTPINIIDTSKVALPIYFSTIGATNGLIMGLCTTFDLNGKLKWYSTSYSTATTYQTYAGVSVSQGLSGVNSVFTPCFGNIVGLSNLLVGTSGKEKLSVVGFSVNTNTTLDVGLQPVATNLQTGVIIGFSGALGYGVNAGTVSNFQKTLVESNALTTVYTSAGVVDGSATYNEFPLEPNQVSNLIWDTTSITTPLATGGGVWLKQSLPFTPSCSLYLTSAVSIFNAITVVPWGGTYFDNYNLHNLGASSKITIPISGKWVFWLSLFPSGQTPGYAWLYKNGAVVQVLFTYNNASSTVQSSGTTILSLSANDYVEVYSKSVNNVTLTSGTGNCNFGCYLLNTF